MQEHRDLVWVGVWASIAIVVVVFVVLYFLQRGF